jgi:hypothetical protein
MLLLTGAELRADSEDGREQRRLEQGSPVMVDTILQAGLAGWVCARLALKYDGVTIGQN